MIITSHSFFSLRYGTIPLEKLVEEASKLGLSSLALTDINNSSACLDFVKYCFEKNIKPVIGIDFRHNNHYLYTGIARNMEGFHELNEFLTEYKLTEKPMPSSAPDFSDVFVLYAPGNKTVNQLRDNEFIGVRPWEINKMVTNGYSQNPAKFIAQYPVTFLNLGEFDIHRHLRAIDKNTLLSMLSPDQLARPEEILLPVDKIIRLYAPFPEIVKNSEHLCNECSIVFDFKVNKNKSRFTTSRNDDQLLLEKLAFEGMSYRYGKHCVVARKRIKEELEIINKLGFAAYFLITWDIVRYSMSRGIYHVGRGSGGNSVVAYCLKITDIDPIELDLYFERFINPKRSSPPDFDIDYSWKDRDEVQDYIFKRYGQKHTALLGAISTFQESSIIRELGKVYGLPRNEIDLLVDHPKAAPDANQITRKIADLSGRLLNFPNIRSIHAGGILISEKPITCYTALDLPPKGYPTTQWDMYSAEVVGFEKLDILSQRGIGHIKEAVDIIYENRKIVVDPHDIAKFKTDEKVRNMLRIGETNGCFYIESPAMRGLLKKLQCDNYLSLVAASSIIRPGVAKSGMMKQYIYRFHHPNDFQYLHPVMEEQLKETFGVMVYQEDVLKVCHHFADLDLADADVLRRAMSGKYRSKKEFEKIVEKYFVNCAAKGYPENIVLEVWRQIESFAGYSFSKAHSASYAVESFQSLYLKTYYPLEFMVAVINNFGGFFRTWVYVNEARRYGALINLPCINRSNNNTCIHDKEIFFGFVHLANLEGKTISAILEERNRVGLFKDLNDFVSRVNIGIEQIIILIRIGAFRFTGKAKKILLWEAHMLVNKTKPEPKPLTMFNVERKQWNMPDLPESSIEDAYDEIELLGFPVTMSHFDLLKTTFRGEVLARDLIKHVGKKVRLVGDLVTIKYVYTVKNEIMNMGCFFDAEGEFFDTVHFPDSLKKYPFAGYGIYLILGVVSEEFGFPSVTVEKLAKLPFVGDLRYS
jgi:DNA-directed DNA polymerase III PolC